MFPEGTRRKKGLVKKYQPRAHTGAARIALGAGAPLIPAAIKGTDNLLGLGPIRVAYGPPWRSTTSAPPILATPPRRQPTG